MLLHAMPQASSSGHSITELHSGHSITELQQILQNLVFDGSEHFVLLSQVIEKSGYQALPWVSRLWSRLCGSPL